MEKYVEVKLIESKTDEKVMAEVTLIKKPDIEYDRVVLSVMGNPVGVFQDDKLQFQPQQFGEIEYEITFYKGDASVWDVEGNIDLNIETWFAAAHPDLGHPLIIAENGHNKELFNRERARGSNDICFRMVVRVPVDEELTIYHVATKQTDPRAKYNQELQVHYRNADYKDRNDLYEPPDEAMFHIDGEKEKWIDGLLTLGHGIHVLYVVPSCQHDMSSLVVSGVIKEKENKVTLDTIIHNPVDNKFSFSFSGFFKTIL
jgi:hypothetical protein